MVDLPLREVGQVTLDSSGNGTVALGPQRANESWQIEFTQCFCTSNSPTPSFTIYIGGVSTTAIVDATYLGAQDNTDTQYTLPAGQYATYQWIGGPPLAIAAVTVTGIRRSRSAI